MAPSSERRATEEVFNDLGREYRALRGLALDGNKVSPYGIYGEDDRLSPDSVGFPPTYWMALEATAAVVETAKFSSPKDGTVDLPSANVMGNGKGLCDPQFTREKGLPEERFWNEPSPAFCSAFKVGDKLMATAAHCVSSQKRCDESSFVFGFIKSATNAHPEKSIRLENVYSCIRVVDFEWDKTTGADWAIVEVDRSIAAPEVVLNLTGSPKVGESVVVSGHPLGLPGKIAGGARVRELGATFFRADLDTYGGNSGSAVFNEERLRKGELFAEGVLVRGEDDFLVGIVECNASKWCPQKGCRGEDVVYAKRLARGLKKAAAAAAGRRASSPFLVLHDARQPRH